MIYRISHTTRYTYSELVSLCHNLIHLTPRETPRQTCRRHGVSIVPSPAATWNGTDYFGNPVMFFTIQEPHQELTVTAWQTTEVFFAEVPLRQLSPPWEEVRERTASHPDAESLDAYQYVFESPYVKLTEELTDYALESFAPGRPFFDALLDLTHRIHQDFRYDSTATTVTTPLQDVMTNRRGVCQDFAHVGIGCLRALGLAARYVSGYLRTMPPPGQPRLVGADASHAWISAYCPGTGWIDVDPTNDVVASEDHIVLAWGRDYDDVSPIKGVILGGGHHSVTVSVDVLPIEPIDGVS